MASQWDEVFEGEECPPGLENLPCDCWAVTWNDLTHRADLLCFYHGWYREIEEDVVEQARRLELVVGEIYREEEEEL